MCEFYGDDDLTTVWMERWRKARKPHVCDTCEATISPGERYLSVFTVYDGAPGSYEQCHPCFAAAKEFTDSHGGGPSPDWFARALSECIADGDEESEKKWKPMLAAIEARRTQANRKPTEGGP